MSQEKDEMSEEIKTEMVETPEGDKPTETSEAKTPVMDVAAELEATRAALKKANNEAAKYRKTVDAIEAERKAKEEAEMTELQKTQKRLAELEASLAEKTLAEKKRGIAEKVGLPPALAVRLQGTSDEEIEQDAKALLQSLPKPAEPAKKPSGINPTNPPNPGQNETDAQKKARLFGESPSFWGG